jgi:hypothetical protein
LAPFSARCLLVCANDGTVDHQMLVIAIGRQCSEHPLPDAGTTPAAEALMDRLPLTVTLRQVAPACAGSQHPQTSVDEQTVVHSRAPGIANLAGQQWVNLGPLRLVVRRQSI